VIGHRPRCLLAGFPLRHVVITIESCPLRRNEEALIAGSKLNTTIAHRRRGCMVVQRLQASTLLLRWSSGPLQGGKNQVEPRLEHDPSFASDSPHNGILCVVLALIGVSTLPHVRCATCRASIQRTLTGQELSLVLRPAYKYKHANMHALTVHKAPAGGPKAPPSA
jgi:hypothetical protein